MGPKFSTYFCEKNKNKYQYAVLKMTDNWNQIKSMSGNHPLAKLEAYNAN